MRAVTSKSNMQKQICKQPLYSSNERCNLRMEEMLSALPNLLRMMWASTLGFVTTALQLQLTK